ncbi:MAG: hypothetical protein VZR23_10010 [Lachnospiraceae bacterium]|nr:hypothetical protein [Lachnospiraceae bacterium]
MKNDQNGRTSNEQQVVGWPDSTCESAESIGAGGKPRGNHLQIPAI